MSRFSKALRYPIQSGFTMLEMLIAIVIMTVGLLAVTVLMSRMDWGTANSRYVGAASLLVTEKLEELSAMPPSRPEIRIYGGNSAGSLTVDQPPYNAGTQTISYYDDVTVTVGDGKISETRSDTSSGGEITISQTPDGQVSTDSLPPASAAVSFKRRWLIEKNVSGFPPSVRRITVRVEYPTGNAQSGAFQMSMVRNEEQ
jgi:prepilin-type N-terminal cleavage/methylation domain-containing protein